MEEFVYPDFIKNNDPDMIHKRMLQRLPPDISTMPGDFAYDFTYPSALEKSELIQFHIVRTLMMMFPQYAWGEYLDLHGQQVNITRNWRLQEFQGLGLKKESVSVLQLQTAPLP